MTYLVKKKSKHNAKLQRTDPGTKVFRHILALCLSYRIRIVQKNKVI